MSTKTMSRSTSNDNVIEILDDDSDDDDRDGDHDNELKLALEESRKSFEQEQQSLKNSKSNQARTRTSTGSSSTTSATTNNNHQRLVTSSGPSSATSKPRDKTSTAASSALKTSSICIDLQDSDSDDDDDMDLLNLKPSGLTKTPTTNSKDPAKALTSGNSEPAPAPKSTPLAPIATAETSSNSHLKSPPAYSIDHQRAVSSSSGSSKITGRGMSTGIAASTAATPISNPYLALVRHNRNASPPAASAPGTTAGRTSSSSSATAVNVEYPPLRQTTKMYEDLRPNLMLGLWTYARRYLTGDSRHIEQFDQFVTRLVALAVMAEPYPIRSLAEYAYRGVVVDGRYRGQIREEHRVKEFEKCMDKTGWIVLSSSTTNRRNKCLPSDACPDAGPSASSSASASSAYTSNNKKYLTVAEACLVGIQEEIMSRWRRQHGQRYVQFPTSPAELDAILKQKDLWVSLSHLIPLVDARLSRDCPSKLGRTADDDNGVAYYQERTTKSAEFKQIEKLIKLPARYTESTIGYLKKHVSKGDWLFELTSLGFQRATIISQQSYPAPVGHYRTSNVVRTEGILRGLCLAVDSREGGGAMSRKTQHGMCNTLDQTGIKYFVGTLTIGDYVLFDRENRLCPILVERKSVEDVAQSIHDGRWQSQKKRMYHGQYVFGYGKCRLVYIIEGNLAKQQISHGYVGNHKFQVDQVRYEKEIEELEEEGFQVIKTPSVDSSMRHLGRWVQKIGEEVENGTLTPKYTYDEFVAAVKKISPNVDFSRLAKFQAQKEKEETDKSRKEEFDRKQQDNTISLLDDDDDDEIGANGISHRRIQMDGNSKSERPNLNKESGKRKGSQNTVNLLDDAEDGCDDKHAIDTSNTPSGTSVNTQMKQNRFGIDSKKRRSPMTADPIRSSRVITETTQAVKNVSNRVSNAASASTSARKRLKSELRQTNTSIDERNITDYSKWTQKALQEECERVGLTKTGNKEKLIKRLNGPRPPPIWLERKKRGMHVPERLDTGGTANLVAIQILQDSHNTGDEFQGGTKEEIYTLAEGLEITKNPYSGGTTQKGPFHYDGWSSMSKLKAPADPPLVIMKKGRYVLSKSSPIAGLPLAREMHRWAHRSGICKCQELGYQYNL